MIHPKKLASPEIYRLRVELLGTNPPVWRQLLVTAATLAHLHNMLQKAVGWTDSHMHEFVARKRRIGRPNPENRFMGGLPSRTSDW